MRKRCEKVQCIIFLQVDSSYLLEAYFLITRHHQNIVELFKITETTGIIKSMNKQIETKAD